MFEYLNINEGFWNINDLQEICTDVFDNKLVVPVLDNEEKIVWEGEFNQHDEEDVEEEEEEEEEEVEDVDNVDHDVEEVNDIFRKNTPTKQYPIILGSGSYGTVVQISDDIVEKRMKLFYKDEVTLQDRNIREILILSSLKAPFIPTVKKVDVDYHGNSIKLAEDYTGIPLDKYARKVPYLRRIELLPTLIFQFSRILLWLKRHNLAHMDIKQSNVCVKEVDGEPFLSIIDFGLAVSVSKHSRQYHGTPEYCDPKYIKHPKIEHAYDMFGVGMTLMEFLNKSYVDYDVWEKISNLDDIERQMKIFEYANVSYHVENILGLENGHEILYIVHNMLSTTKVITPLQIFGHKIFREFREKYPLVASVSDDDFLEERSEYTKIFDKVYNFTSTRPYLTEFSYRLMCRFINVQLLHEAVPILIAYYIAACINITAALFDKCIYVLDDKEMINKYAIEILDKFGWKIFPNKMSNFVK